VSIDLWQNFLVRLCNKIVGLDLAPSAKWLRTPVVEVKKTLPQHLNL